MAGESHVTFHASEPLCNQRNEESERLDESYLWKVVDALRVV